MISIEKAKQTRGVGVKPERVGPSERRPLLLSPCEALLLPIFVGAAVPDLEALTLGEHHRRSPRA